MGFEKGSSPAIGHDSGFRPMTTLLIALLVLTQVEAKPAPVAPKPVLALVSTIAMPKVEGRIDHMAFAPKPPGWTGNALVIAALGNDTVELVDLAAHEVLARPTRQDVHEPQGAAFMNIGGQAYYAVTNGASGDLDIHDLSSAEPLDLVQRIHVGDDADNVRFHETTRTLIVGHGSGAMAIVGPVASRKWEIQATIPLDAHPESFQIDSAGKRCWVNVPGTQSIAVVDLEQKRVVRSIHVEAAKKNYPMALDEPQKRLIVGCRDPGKLLVFDIETDKLLDTLPLSGDVDDIFVDAARGLVYAACGEGFVDVFERTQPGAWKPREKVATSAGARTCLFVASEERLFVAVPHRGDQKAEIRVFSTAP